MKAMLCKAYGGPEDLVLDDLPDRKPEAGEVRIAVKAAGVNFFDILMIGGTYQFKPPFPFAPGAEVAGEVIDVGPGVTTHKPGDRVMANISHNGYATEAVVPSFACFPIPPGMSFEQAAGFVIVYGTSHVGLQHRAKLQPGETLLVHGAAGGVGLTAVEIGKIMGATVIACASSDEKLAVCKQHGADHTVNYASGQFKDEVKKLTRGNGANVIYDPVGGDVLLQSLRCVAWEGRILVVGFASGQIPAVPANMILIKNCAVMGHFWGAYQMHEPSVISQSLDTLFQWYSQGKLHPHVSATFPLTEAARAMRSLMNRTATGKVILVPS